MQNQQLLFSLIARRITARFFAVRLQTLTAILFAIMNIINNNIDNKLFRIYADQREQRRKIENQKGHKLEIQISYKNLSSAKKFQGNKIQKLQNSANQAVFLITRLLTRQPQINLPGECQVDILVHSSKFQIIKR